MSNLTSKLSKELFQKYESISVEECDTLSLMEYGDIESMITTLIGDYNTYKLLLIEEEYKLEKNELELEKVSLLHQKLLMEEGMKITEAKQQTRVNFKKDYEELASINRDIALLKANIHSVEYQLRFKFQQLKIYGNLEELEDEQAM